MNKTVALVNAWAAYESEQPEATLEGFCRHYLMNHHQADKESLLPNFGGGAVPPQPKNYLLKLISYLTRIGGEYFQKAFEHIPEIRKREDFYLLNTIHTKRECRKTEVIYDQVMDLTTGMDALARLIQSGLLEERVDPADRRARLLRLTAEGERVLFACYQASRAVAQLMFFSMQEEEVLWSISLLKHSEAIHSARFQELRDLSFEAAFELITGSTSPWPADPGPPCK